MTQQGARQQPGKAEDTGRCGGHEDRGELGAVSQLGHKHQGEGLPDHRPGGRDRPALLSGVDHLHRLLRLLAGGIGRHALGIQQQLHAEHQEQNRRQPGHHRLGQQLAQAVAQPEGDQGDGGESRKGAHEHPAGPVAHRQDQGHEKGLVAQLRQGDGGEAGAEGRQRGLAGEGNGHRFGIAQGRSRRREDGDAAGTPPGTRRDPTRLQPG